MQSTRRSARMRSLIGAAIAATLLATACSNDNNPDAASSSSAAAPDETAANTPATPAEVESTDPTAATDPVVEDTVEVTSAAPLESGLGSRATGRKIVFVADNPPSDPFWGTIQRGAQDAAALFNIDLDYQFTPEGADINAYNELIGTAVAADPDALIIVVRDQDVLTENICAASSAGIPVMSYNIGPDAGGDVDKCVLGFIGQDFPAAGYKVAQDMIALAGIGEGDLVLLPVEQPERAVCRATR